MPSRRYSRPRTFSETSQTTPYLRPGDLLLLLPYSRGTIDRMVASGQLPAPDVIRPNLRLWRKDVMIPAIENLLGTVEAPWR